METFRKYKKDEISVFSKIKSKVMAVINELINFRKRRKKFVIYGIEFLRLILDWDEFWWSTIVQFPPFT